MTDVALRLPSNQTPLLILIFLGARHGVSCHRSPGDSTDLPSEQWHTSKVKSGEKLQPLKEGGRANETSCSGCCGIERLCRMTQASGLSTSEAYQGIAQQLGDCLGKGAFGSVYRALNWGTGETVAVKQIKLADLPKSELRVIMVRQ